LVAVMPLLSLLGTQQDLQKAAMMIMMIMRVMPFRSQQLLHKNVQITGDTRCSPVEVRHG